MTKPQHDHLYKILLIGDSAVGKTSLLLRFVDDAFNKTFIATIGIDFKVKTVNIDDKSIKLQIWDTAGQERFRTITSMYYRGADGILLVYDITKRESFERIQVWLKNIREHATDRVEIFLVGNKTDLDAQREVSTAEATTFAQNHELPFLETSSLTGSNVKDAFMSLAREVHQNCSASALGGGGGGAGADNSTRLKLDAPKGVGKTAPFSNCC